MTILYSDGIANISIRDSVTRIDLFTVKPTQDGNEKKETLEASGTLILPVSGFLRLHEQMSKAISDMQEKGLIKKKDTDQV